MFGLIIVAQEYEAISCTKSSSPPVQQGKTMRDRTSLSLSGNTGVGPSQVYVKLWRQYRKSKNTDDEKIGRIQGKMDHIAKTKW